MVTVVFCSLQAVQRETTGERLCCRGMGFSRLGVVLAERLKTRARAAHQPSEALLPTPAPAWPGANSGAAPPLCALPGQPGGRITTTGGGLRGVGGESGRVYSGTVPGQQGRLTEAMVQTLKAVELRRRGLGMGKRLGRRERVSEAGDDGVGKLRENKKRSAKSPLSPALSLSGLAHPLSPV